MRQISRLNSRCAVSRSSSTNVALGDIVETEASAPRKYLISRVLAPSGRYVFRLWFGESFQPRDEIAKALRELEALLEWSSRNLLAVDARDAAHAQVIADLLADRGKQGHPVYEPGKTAWPAAAGEDFGSGLGALPHCDRRRTRARSPDSACAGSHPAKPTRGFSCYHGWTPPSLPASVRRNGARQFTLTDYCTSSSRKPYNPSRGSGSRVVKEDMDRGRTRGTGRGGETPPE